ncbi:hypothetical protein Tco_0710012 [Tanacetum coccineum]
MMMMKSEEGSKETLQIAMVRSSLNDADDILIGSCPMLLRESKHECTARIPVVDISNIGRELDAKNGGSGILKEELNRIDADIDKGLASDIIINRRMEVIKSIQYLDKIHVMEFGQTDKVKWAIEWGCRTLDIFMGGLE